MICTAVNPRVFGTLIQDFHRVSTDNIRQLAARYLVLGRLTIVVVGDRKALYPDLETLGNVAD